MAFEDDYPTVNGTVWALRGSMRRVLTYVGSDQYVLLGIGKSIMGWPAYVMNAQHFEGDKSVLTLAEMIKALEGWECLGYWKGDYASSACPPDQLDKPTQSRRGEQS